MWPIPEDVAVGLIVQAIATPAFQVAIARWFAEDVVPHLPVYDRPPDRESHHP